MIALVYSTRDPAGSGSASALLSMASWSGSSCPRATSCLESRDLGTYLAGFTEDVIEMDFLDEVFRDHGVDAYVVLSRHSSRSGRPSLTVHTTGNHGPADFGGRPRELAWSNPRLEGALLRNYARSARDRGLLDRYWVGLEATHHGPTDLSRPITFIEIGSTEVEWSDARAQESLAEAVIGALTSPSPPPDCRPAAGFGGTHYPERHTRLVLEGGVCYGHVLAKYALEEPDPDVISQAIDRNYGGVSEVVVERKSMGAAARDVVSRAAELRGLPVTYI
ncbi:MAG: D-aminoacyl-tRNA deacylase [Conexivisphaera sp.]|jgi:D-aminoacyl-tRNA deacylase